MRLALVLPGLAIGFAGAIILGPGNDRAVVGARVHAAPAVDDVIPSVRLVLVRRLDGAEEAAAGDPIVVEVGAARATPRAGSDGVVDVVLDPPARRGDRLIARSGDHVLADGRLDVARGEPPTTQLGSAAGRADGAIRIRIAPQRGHVTPPFPETVALRLTRLEGGREIEVAGRVELDVVGGSPATAAIDVDPAKGPGLVVVTPEALRVDVEARAKDAAGHEGRFSGNLDTVPGAIWLDPAATGELRVSSPAPRRAAYLSVHTGRGRVAGFAVPLSDHGDGFHRGSVPLPAGVEGPAVIVAAGDPEERGPATVAWPLAADGGAAMAPRLVRVIDGVAPAEAAEHARAVGARRLAVIVAAACGLLSILSLVLEGRRAQRALDVHLATAGEGATPEAQRAFTGLGRGAARAGSGMVTLLGALIALAFGVVAALVLVR